MWSEAEFRRLVSGQRRGVWAGSLRGALSAGALAYSAASALRNWHYDHRQGVVERVAAPVVSVGNLTLGGTGKTPMVAYLARWFQNRSLPVAIVSRGYRAVEAGGNDEAMELAKLLPGVPHVQHKRRVLAARQAICQHGAAVVILDDGFQHRRLGRDLDLVLIDALEPFGYRRLFPRGLLREPLGQLRRAHVVGLSRSELVAEEQREAIRTEVARRTDAAWIELIQSPAGWISARGERLPAEALSDRSVLAFCGIGNPEAFRRTLLALGTRVERFEAFPDHFAYRDEDLVRLARMARSAGAEALVCTGKDLVKCRADAVDGMPIWALRIEVEVVTGRDELDMQLETICRMATASEPSCRT